jgi:hypothetical protein
MGTFAVAQELDAVVKKFPTCMSASAAGPRRTTYTPFSGDRDRDNASNELEALTAA